MEFFFPLLKEAYVFFGLKGQEIRAQHLQKATHQLMPQENFMNQTPKGTYPKRYPKLQI